MNDENAHPPKKKQTIKDSLSKEEAIKSKEKNNKEKEATKETIKTLRIFPFEINFLINVTLYIRYLKLMII